MTYLRFRGLNKSKEGPTCISKAINKNTLSQPIIDPIKRSADILASRLTVRQWSKKVKREEETTQTAQAAQTLLDAQDAPTASIDQDITQGIPVADMGPSQLFSYVSQFDTDEEEDEVDTDG